MKKTKDCVIQAPQIVDVHSGMTEGWMCTQALQKDKQRLCNTSSTNSGCALGRHRRKIKAPLIVDHSQKSWVILLMNIHKPNRVIYDVSK